MYFDQQLLNVIALGVAVLVASLYVPIWISHFGLSRVARCVSSLSIAGVFTFCVPQAAHGNSREKVVEAIADVESPDPWLAQTTDNSAYVVAPGDSLWAIAQREQQPDESLEKLWLTIVKDNTPKVRSGNPNLIYPGEVITIYDH